MPLYEYRCGQCGHLFEILARNSQDIADTCPKCGAANPEKQFSAFAVGSPAPSRYGGSKCNSCAASGSCPYAGSNFD